MKSRIRKLTTCQIRAVRLIPSEFRISMTLVDLAEEQEGDNERVDRHGFGKGDADDHGQQHRAARLRIAADRLHCLAAQDADADTGSDGAKSNGEACCEGREVHSVLLDELS